ncbi:MAG: hypothetical protein KIS96_05215 [Bauldia sp.]|nr:hypothetical protein [Bauldia sp.]
MRLKPFTVLLAAILAGTAPASVAIAQQGSPYAALNLPEGQLDGAQVRAFLLAAPIRGADYIYTYFANGTWSGAAVRNAISPQTLTGTWSVSPDGVVTRIGETVRTFTIERNGNRYFRIENGQRTRLEPAV